jgi:hypothetical protein
MTPDIIGTAQWMDGYEVKAIQRIAMGRRGAPM